MNVVRAVRQDWIALLVGDRSVAIAPKRDAPDGAPFTVMAGESFESIYDRHYRDVYRYVLLSLRRHEDVDDVVSDAFQRAFASWQSGRGPTGRALPWLLLIARRIIVDRWRRERLLRWLPLSRPGQVPVDPPDADDQGVRAEFWMWLDQLAAALPDRQRQVVFLRYQRDLTDEEIGAILGLSSSGVRTLASRAIAALRAHPELWS